MPPIRNGRRAEMTASSRSTFDDPITDKFLRLHAAKAKRLGLSSYELLYPPPELSEHDSSSSPSPATSAGTFSSPSPVSLPSLLPPPPPPPQQQQHNRKRVSQPSRKKNEPHVRRPPNPFILFRSAFWDEEKKKDDSIKDHRMISKLAGEAWNNLTPAQQAPYKRLAQEVKIRHQEEYPDYRYSPGSRKEPPAPVRAPKTTDEEQDRCKAIAQLIINGLKGPALAAAIQQLVEMAPKVKSTQRSSKPRSSRSSGSVASSSPPPPKLVLHNPGLHESAEPSEESLPPHNHIPISFVPAELGLQCINPLLLESQLSLVPPPPFRAPGPTPEVDEQCIKLLCDTLMATASSGDPSPHHNSDFFIASGPLLPESVPTDSQSLFPSSLFPPEENPSTSQGALELQPLFELAYPGDAESGVGQESAESGFYPWFSPDSF